MAAEYNGKKIALSVTVDSSGNIDIVSPEGSGVEVTKSEDGKTFTITASGKVDKSTSTSGYYLYARGAGVEEMLPFTEAANSASIMYRDASGRSKIANPVADKDIANKSYVDGRLTMPTIGYAGNEPVYASAPRFILVNNLEGKFTFYLVSEDEVTKFVTIPFKNGTLAMLDDIQSFVYIDDSLLGG